MMLENQEREKGVIIAEEKGTSVFQGDGYATSISKETRAIQSTFPLLIRITYQKVHIIVRS